MCAAYQAGRRFPIRLRITAGAAGRQEAAAAAAGKPGRPLPPRLSASDGGRSPAQPATVNVSLAEIITVTQPSHPLLPHLPRSWRPVAPANFRATYSRLNGEISAGGGKKKWTGGRDKGQRRRERAAGGGGSAEVQLLTGRNGETSVEMF